MASRIPELMLMCADNLDRGCDAMNSSFLSENNITFEECSALSKILAVAIRAYARSSIDEKVLLMIRASFDDVEERERMVENMRHVQQSKKTLKGLAACKKWEPARPAPAEGAAS